MVYSLIIVLAIVGCAHRGMGDEGLRELSRRMTKFSQNLHEDLALEQVNSVYSPASIHLALSMAYLGARGSTAEGMKSALQLTKSERSTQITPDMGQGRDLPTRCPSRHCQQPLVQRKI
ncbi:unnamed protein product [Lymnaea stagnalis]|uniref:Serpin domain-containing protein n=1 Tax=Lymnaea stagnalis TaxID=6523 RepID=A0AAV2HQJ5_LYMST